jgi:two-component system response regulator HydG
LKVLIIDDDVDICYLLNDFLKSENIEAETAFDGATGLKKLEKTKHDVVLCDFRLPDFDGLDMVGKIKGIHSAAQVIIITGYSDVKIAVNAMKKGVYEYVTKPIYPDEILHTIKSAFDAFKNKTVETEEIEKKGASMKNNGSASPIQKFEYVEGSDDRSANLHRLMKMVAPTNMSCLILGESGTGKEYVAKRLHELSLRQRQPFVALDCGAIPADLASSELFGHVKGSFTGALKDKKGHFEMANSGTLFLDEVGNLSYENQIKLLRVLQERVIKRVGGAKDIPVDVRIISATNEDLIDAVNKGEFREDLYHRLNEFKLEVAPLRQRVGDIEVFAKYFLKQANLDLNKQIEGFSPEATTLLNKHQWPGNLREMKNIVKRAVLMEQNDKISAEVLPSEIGNPEFSSSLSSNTELPLNLKEAVEEVEKRTIAKVLEIVKNNKSKAAQMLGVDRKTLYNKLNQYNLQ